MPHSRTVSTTSPVDTFSFYQKNQQKTAPQAAYYTYRNSNSNGNSSSSHSRSHHSSYSRRVEANQFGDYILGSTLGEGEFGKVKMAWRRHRSSNTQNSNSSASSAAVAAATVASGSSSSSAIVANSPDQVAIKLIRKDTIASNSSQEAKVRREIRVLRRMHHPNIIQLIEVMQNDLHIGIVLDYASGGELFDYILSYRYLKESVACRLFAQLISAVDYMHSKGIVHRDLKLENILLDKYNNVLITDFGFANQFDAPALRHGYREAELMKTSCGSPCYAAPELVISSSPYEGRKVDVWSLGVILYAMLAGYLPYDDDPDNPEGKNILRLYKYITSTPLTFPEYIRPMPRDLLRRILVSHPEKRATLLDVKSHPWLAPYSAFLSISSDEWERRMGYIHKSNKNDNTNSNSSSTNNPYHSKILANNSNTMPMARNSTNGPLAARTANRPTSMYVPSHLLPKGVLSGSLSSEKEQINNMNNIKQINNNNNNTKKEQNRGFTMPVSLSSSSITSSSSPSNDAPISPTIKDIKPNEVKTTHPTPSPSSVTTKDDSAQNAATASATENNDMQRAAEFQRNSSLLTATNSPTRATPRARLPTSRRPRPTSYAPSSSSNFDLSDVVSAMDSLSVAPNGSMLPYSANTRNSSYNGVPNSSTPVVLSVTNNTSVNTTNDKTKQNNSNGDSAQSSGKKSDNVFTIKSKGSTSTPLTQENKLSPSSTDSASPATTTSFMVPSSGSSSYTSANQQYMVPSVSADSTRSSVEVPTIKSTDNTNKAIKSDSKNQSESTPLPKSQFLQQSKRSIDTKIESPRKNSSSVTTSSSVNNISSQIPQSKRQHHARSVSQSQVNFSSSQSSHVKSHSRRGSIQLPYSEASVFVCTESIAGGEISVPPKALMSSLQKTHMRTSSASISGSISSSSISSMFISSPTNGANNAYGTTNGGGFHHHHHHSRGASLSLTPSAFNPGSTLPSKFAPISPSSPAASAIGTTSYNAANDSSALPDIGQNDLQKISPNDNQSLLLNQAVVQTPMSIDSLKGDKHQASATLPRESNFKFSSTPNGDSQSLPSFFDAPNQYTTNKKAKTSEASNENVISARDIPHKGNNNYSISSSSPNASIRANGSVNGASHEGSSSTPLPKRVRVSRGETARRRLSAFLGFSSSPSSSSSSFMGNSDAINSRVSLASIDRGSINSKNDSPASNKSKVSKINQASGSGMISSGQIDSNISYTPTKKTRLEPVSGQTIIARNISGARIQENASKRHSSYTPTTDGSSSFLGEIASSADTNFFHTHHGHNHGHNHKNNAEYNNSFGKSNNPQLPTPPNSGHMPSVKYATHDRHVELPRNEKPHLGGMGDSSNFKPSQQHVRASIDIGAMNGRRSVDISGLERGNGGTKSGNHSRVSRYMSSAQKFVSFFKKSNSKN